jgi:hypothetical protein
MGDMLDHQEAVRSKAVERYLLGQMSDSETESFELHFFECEECAGELRTGAVFVENARQVFRERPAAAPASSPSRGRGRWSWLTGPWTGPAFAATAFASLVLAAATFYQGAFLLPELRRQVSQANTLQSVPEFTFTGATRGEAPSIAVPSGALYFALHIDLPDNSFSSYRCELSSGQGPARFSVDSRPPRAGDPLTILVPARALASGSYTLSVHGLRDSGSGPEIGPYTFLLTHQ